MKLNTTEKSQSWMRDSMIFHIQVPVLFCADANATRDATDARRVKESMMACGTVWGKRTRRNGFKE